MIASKERFAFWFVFSFVLNGYASGIPGVSLGSLLFVFFIILSFLSPHKYKCKSSIYLLLVGFLFISILDYVTVGLYGNPIIGILKLAIWGLMINRVTPSYIRFDSLQKWFNILSIVLISYLAVQIVGFYVLGIYFPNIFTFGPLQPYDEGYADYSLLSESIILRPASLLSESSFLGNFLLVSLLINLDSTKELKGKSLLFPLFLSLGVIMTTSTSAMVLLVLVWLVYFGKLNKYIKAGILVVSVVFSIQIIKTGIELINIKDESSLGYSIEKFNHLDTSTRFGKSYDYLVYLKGSNRVLGVGVGNETSFIASHYSSNSDEDIYLNSVTGLLFSVGILGTFLFTLFIVYLFLLSIKRKSRLSLCIILIYVIKAFSSGILFSTYGILFLMIVYADIVYGKHCRT